MEVWILEDELHRETLVDRRFKFLLAEMGVREYGGHLRELVLQWIPRIKSAR